jgi:hypothetical protein
LIYSHSLPRIAFSGPSDLIQIFLQQNKKYKVRSIPGVVNDRKTAPLFFFNHSLFAGWKGSLNKEKAVEGEQPAKTAIESEENLRNDEMNYQLQPK